MGAPAARVVYILLVTVFAQRVSGKFFHPATFFTASRRTSASAIDRSLNIKRRVDLESIGAEKLETTRCSGVRGGSFKQKSMVNVAMSIRGGSSELNTVQTILKSILTTPLPEPIKKVIAMIFRLLENISGLQMLPPAEKKSKKKRSNPKANEVLVEKVSAGGKKKRTKKKAIESNNDEVPMSASGAEITTDSSGKRKKKRKTASSASAEVKKDEEAQEEEVSTQQTKSASIATKQKQPAKTDAASKKFLSNNLKSSNPNYRIQRELKEFLKSPPPGLSVKISGKNVRLWVITLSMPDNSIYAGEKYKLRVQFPNDYPTSPPSVFFLPPTPRHEHVYTNGDICLSLLGKDWRPIMTAQSIAQAIFSILCGAQRKSLPMDNARHAGNKPGQKQDDWVYHDDNC